MNIIMKSNKQKIPVTQHQRLIIHIKTHNSPQILSKENNEKEEEKTLQLSPSHSLLLPASEASITSPIQTNTGIISTQPPSPTDTLPLPLTPPSPCFSHPPPTPPTSSPSLNNTDIDNNEIFDRERIINVLESKDSSIKEKAHSLKSLTDNIDENMSINFLAGVEAVLFEQEQILKMGEDILIKNEKKDCDEFYREYGRFSVAANYHRQAYFEKKKKNNNLLLNEMEIEKAVRKGKWTGLKERSKRRIKKPSKKKEVIEIDSDESDVDEIMDFEEEYGFVDFGVEEESEDDSSYNPHSKKKAKKKIDVKFIKKITPT